MSKHDSGIALKQILAHSQEAIQIARGKTRSDLDSDRLLELALTRLVEIIGEAANRVPGEIQTLYPELPWLQMVGARNRLIHGYDSVDLDVLWAIVQKDLPVLIRQLEKILQSL